MKFPLDEEIGRNREIALAIFVRAAAFESAVSALQVRSAVRSYFDTGNALESFMFVRNALSEAAFKRGEAEYVEGLEQGFRLVHFASPDYPAGFRSLPDPPLSFWVAGRLQDDEHPVAVIGSRKSSEAGERFALQIAVNLAANGVSVVSGLARGIDSAAHRGAVSAAISSARDRDPLSSSNRVTSGVAILGSGLCRVYPKENIALAEELLSTGGCLISEYPLHQPPLAFLFPDRNRLLAGLAKSIVVVEARHRSGSLITARLGAELSRDIFTVPGSISSAECRGSNELLRLGARVLLSPDELSEIMPFSWRGRSVVSKPWGPKPPEVQRTNFRTDEDFRAAESIVATLWEAGTLDSEELQRRLSISPDTLRGQLGKLEATGLIERTSDGRWASSSGE